jgi:hypothetical protein
MAEMTTTQQLHAELLAELRYVRAHTSRTAELLATGVKNNVLEVATATFNSDGVISLSWSAVCGSIVVRNLSTSATVTVAAGPASVSPTGIGSWTVPVGKVDVVNVNARVLTLYGTSGEKVCYQAFTVGARPEAGGS